ncbi:adrenocorticotropic hormone receptor-like [Antedon mediterranea]|uniref:adrenocorticotropic hormone receptor-like n=1 Tax=Antedon mediterranea TaxID=105859 RepID=UPI003AF570CD
MINGTDWIFCQLPVVFALSHFIISILVLLANGMTVAAVVSVKDLQKPNFIILTSVAIVDFSTACWMLTGLGKWTQTGQFYYTEDYIGSLAFNVTTFHILFSYIHHIYLVSERYLAIFYPYFYVAKIDNKSVTIALVISWAVWIALAVSVTLEYSIDEFFPIILIFLGLTCLPMYGSHTRIYLEAGKVFREITSMSISNNPAGNHHQRQTRTQNFKATRTTAIILGAFSISMIPYFLQIVYELITGKIAERVCNIGFYLSSSFVYLNCVMNPIIYYVTNTKFRNFNKKIMCK